MRVVGVLVWYDESPAWLAAAVAGFARVCDAIVACDGSYLLYPGARARSNPEQAEAIVLACESADVECVLHRPSQLYAGNEVEKRNQSLKLAGALNPDWVMVFDADYHVMRCDAEIVRWELENTDLNVATYTVLSNHDLLADEDQAKIARENPVDTEWTIRSRDVYRWTSDLAYGPAHYTISGTYDGDVQWIRGPEMVHEPPVPVVDALDLRAALVVHHRNKDRALVRNRAREGFYKMRDLYGSESIEEWRKVPA